MVVLIATIVSDVTYTALSSIKKMKNRHLRKKYKRIIIKWKNKHQKVQREVNANLFNNYFTSNRSKNVSIVIIRRSKCS